VFSGASGEIRVAKRILLLEDDLTLLRLLKGSLQDEGHFVAETDEAATALHMIETEEWDLVITDGALKTSRGEDFAAQVRERRAGVPVLLITGSSRPVSDPSLFQGVLYKPFRRDDFLSFVDAALDRLDESAAKVNKAA